MPSVTTTTCSVNFPAQYEQIHINWESIRAEHQTDYDYISFVSIGLQELSFYHKFTGNNLLDQFRASCFEQRGTVELIADKTLPVAGTIAEIRTTQSPDGYFYYFGLITINSEYGYTIIADCDIAVKDFYEPIFDEIWQSLQYFGNPAEAMQQQQDAITALLNKHTPATSTAQQPPTVILPFIIPTNEQPYWQIGKHHFKLIGNLQAHISDGDGALFVKIEAEAPNEINPDNSDLISSYNNRKVYLQFYFKGIYNAGIPTGKFYFEKERNEGYLTYLWKGGFNYSQELTAEVTLEKGWLGLEGHFHQYPVKLAVKLPLEQLNWNAYYFRTLEEMQTATPEVIHHLWLINPSTTQLQQALLPLIYLETLSIEFPHHHPLAADFTVIPPAVQYLQQLKTLSITGASALDHLPGWLGNLQKLETITLQGSQVASIPPSIMQLPVLKKLYLNYNQLQSIPSQLTPSLETLLVSNNQLTKVPASATQLQSLNIEHNPLQQLPAGLENIRQLHLELEKKISLLDYTYKGANGQGIMAYDDSHFHAKNNIELLHLLEAGIKNAALTEFKEALINRARASVALATTEEDTYATKGNHRFGGLPDLPVGTPYPTFTTYQEEEKGMLFIAQINCAAIAHLQNYLPTTGMLYFFIEDLDAVAPKVIYYNGNELQSAKDLHITPDFIYEDNGIYTPFRAEAAKYASIPSLYNSHRLYPELENMEEQYEATEQLEKSLHSLNANPIHSINSYVFKQHDTPEIEAVDAKRGKPEEWMVLLKVSSDPKTGFQFWDAGVIYFVIHKSDLERKDFTNVYCGLESS
ncbi:Uncharacterized protein YwqG [Filimonas lacunae]|uniref:Uncharacterized protein YwqG n=1 Tax=Filimonas lacunae TaxID=477680 RepID=A0A173MB81_9BACT|nr:DUF1963 domain-containing protein [Filimonas lacunae]BAV04741.1 hypothetical protein FLA_0740 [Filimonas lacunae]SIT32211.1 Uncharacterized protein YwqG [Filimonas lacunae]